uniref:Uncharacterized protein n=1 Tax=Caenorhabditis japonica TaxID=281687 RepID=A0A8R1E6N2_CAEJA
MPPPLSNALANLQCSGLITFIVFSIDLRHENARLRPLICTLPVCVSSNITVFAWSRPNKWVEPRVLMSQID